MSAIDEAAVRLTPAAGTDRERLPAVARAALAFVAMQVPLTLIALAFEWRGTWGTSDEHGPLLEDFLRYGSGVSGPLLPQLILLALVFGVSRGGRIGRVAAAAIGVMGVLIAFNGVMAGLSDPDHTPRAALLAAAALFASFGAALATLGARRALGR
jgi:hypothetical protein